MLTRILLAANNRAQSREFFLGLLAGHISRSEGVVMRVCLPRISGGALSHCLARVVSALLKPKEFRGKAAFVVYEQAEFRAISIERSQP